MEGSTATTQTALKHARYEEHTHIELHIHSDTHARAMKSVCVCVRVCVNACDPYVRRAMGLSAWWESLHICYR